LQTLDCLLLVEEREVQTATIWQSVGQIATTDNLLSDQGDTRGEFRLRGRHSFVVSEAVGLHHSSLGHSRKCCRCVI